MGKQCDKERTEIISPEIRESSPGCRFPVRFFFLVNSFFAFILVYANKVALSVAIVKMVTDNRTLSDLEMLPGQVEPVDVEPGTKGMLLGAFFWGYILSQVPAGRMAERFGGKWLLGVSLLICSLICFIIPALTLHEQNWVHSKDTTSWFIQFYKILFTLLGEFPGLQILRSLQGFCSGVAHPCMHSLISKWTPKDKRSMTASFIYSGSQIGTLLTLPLSGYLCSTSFLGGWPSIFYVLGIFGVCWFVSWSFFVYDTPSSHPFIHPDQLVYLQKETGNDLHKNVKIPWKKVGSSIHVWALTVAHFGQNFGFFLLLTYLPTYLSSALHVNIKDNGVISALPYLAQAVSAWVASYVSDRIVRSEKVPLSVVRKTFNSIGFYGPALCFIAMALAPYSYNVVVISLIVALGLNGCSLIGFHVVHVDMAPAFAGTLMGITNAISNINGVIVGKLISAITVGGEGWWLVFVIAAVVYIVTNTFFVIFGTSKLQPWAVAAMPMPDTVIINGNETCNNCSFSARKSLGLNHICEQISQNYSNLRKSSNNFVVLDRSLGNIKRDSLVAMCDSTQKRESLTKEDEAHLNTAFNGDLNVPSKPQ